MEILLRTLNQQSVVVTDSIISEHTKSGKQSIVNKNETILAMEKQKLLIDKFKSWVWSDEERKKLLEEIYEEIGSNSYKGSYKRGA